MKCPKCGAGSEYFKRLSDGSLVCSRCGLVIEDLPIDTGPEYRIYSPEDKIVKQRVGPPRSLAIHDYGTTTFIRGRDERALKLARLQAKVRKHGYHALISVLQEANAIARRANVPQYVAEEFAKLVRELHDMGLLKKNTRGAYLAAALVAASRITRYTALSFREAARIVGVRVDDVWAAYRSLVQRLKLKVTRPPKSIDYVPSIVSKLNLPQQVETLALRLLRHLEVTGIAQGKPPHALAAAAVYLASILMDCKRNQSQVARAVNVTDATIRNRYRDIVDNFYIEVSL